MAVFSPDGRTLLTAGNDKTARLWDAATGQAKGEPMRHEGAVWAATFSPDGKLLVTGGTDMNARVWDTATGRQQGGSIPHEGTVLAVGFGRDSRTVLTAGSDNAAPDLATRRRYLEGETARGMGG